MTRPQDYLVSVVVPMYYEEAVAQACHDRLTAALAGVPHYELVYVNDGSRDATLPILRAIAAADEHVKVISFARNFGHQAAVSAGVGQAEGDAVVIIDADLQDPPELIPDMLALWQQGYDVVYAQREKRKGESFFKLATANLFYRVLDALTDVAIPRDTGDFRLIDRAVAQAFLAMPEHNRFIRGMIPFLGFETTPIRYVRDERLAGETKYPLKKMLRLAMDGMLGFSNKPVVALRTLAVLVLLAALAVLVLGICLPAARATALVCAAVFFGTALVLAGLYVLGEYLIRTLDEVRARPLYVIKERFGRGGRG